jgi:hypothetical protein
MREIPDVLPPEERRMSTTNPTRSVFDWSGLIE